MSALWDSSREGEPTLVERASARDWTPERNRALVLGPTHLLISRRFLGLLISAVLLAALWLCLRVVYFNGFYLEDSPGYVTDAAYVALGEFRARDYITGLNVGIFAPVGLALALFGKTEAAVSLWPLACSLLGMASMGAAVGVLCGRRWGVLAALLYATYPGDIFFSTVVMPDAIQAGWLTFSVLLVILAFAAPQPDVRLLFAGGAAMAVCQLIRANGPILLPIGVVAVAILARRLHDQPARRVSSFGCLVPGGLAVRAGARERRIPGEHRRFLPSRARREPALRLHAVDCEVGVEYGCGHHSLQCVRALAMGATRRMGETQLRTVVSRPAVRIRRCGGRSRVSGALRVPGSS